MNLQDNKSEINKQSEDNNNENESNFKAGFVAVVGRPSVGKSTFINYVCGKNTAITSSYPQTTRSIIRGIVTRPHFQIILLDTPGIHISDSIYGKHLTQQAQIALNDAEIILYILDATRSPAQEDQNIVSLLKLRTIPVFVAINKMDSEQPKIVRAHLQMLRNELGDKVHECHFISANEGINIEDILVKIADTLPSHDAFYPKDYYTDQTPEFRICEQVRAAALEYVHEELPHALYVEILETSIKNTDDEGQLTHLLVRAQLVVEKPSQQGILIGKSGKMIRKIRYNATKRLKPLFDYNVQLELRVMVKKKWRRDTSILGKMG